MRVAQLAGTTDVDHVDRVDAHARDVAPADPGAEGEMGQDGQFLRGVAAVDVGRRIRLGVAALLGLGQGRGILGVVLLHLAQDEVARAVEDGVDRLDVVGRKALGQGRDDGDAAGHGRLKGDRAAHLPRQGEQLRPVLGQQGLVRGDHVLAALQQLRRRSPGPARPR